MNKKVFRLPVVWQMSGYIEVEEENLHKAMNKVRKNLNDFKFPSECNYVDKSFKLETNDPYEMKCIIDMPDRESRDIIAKVYKIINIKETYYKCNYPELKYVGTVTVKGKEFEPGIFCEMINWKFKNIRKPEGLNITDDTGIFDEYTVLKDDEYSVYYVKEGSHFIVFRTEEELLSHFFLLIRSLQGKLLDFTPKTKEDLFNNLLFGGII